MLIAQTNTKKAAPPSARPDTWQRSKGCADQAAKVMAGAHELPKGQYHSWNKHYSPKYDRCFIEIRIIADDPISPTRISTELQDAFERRTKAYLMTAPTPNPYGTIEFVRQFLL